jgi:hypothetical protein
MIICHHCKKEIEKIDENVICIMKIDYLSLYFHQECFIQVAGEEYIPKKHSSTNEWEFKKNRDELQQWFKDLESMKQKINSQYLVPKELIDPYTNYPFDEEDAKADPLF